MTPKPFSLSIIIPAYNEAGNIGHVIDQVVREVSTLVKDFELIVVDDGSGDGTYEEAARAAAAHSNVRVLRHTANQGWGAGLRTGFTSAEKTWVIGLPADNQFEIKELSRFVSAVRKDIDIIASRRVNRQDPPNRRLISKMFNWAMRTFYGVRIHDINWVKMFRREIFDELPIEVTGFAVDAEIMVKAHRLGYRHTEIEVSHHPRVWGASTTLKLGRIYRTAREIASIPFLTAAMIQKKKRPWTLILPPEALPPWVAPETPLRLPRCGVKSYEGSGEVLAHFQDGDRRVPAIVREKGTARPLFDLPHLFQTMGEEKYTDPMKPITAALPFSYHKLPAAVRLAAARAIFYPHRFTRPGRFPRWPVEPSMEVLRYAMHQLDIPIQTMTWPHGKKYAVCVTHDVETPMGMRNARKFSDLEAKYSVKGCYYMVSGEYPLDENMIQEFIAAGHEIGSHDDVHDNTIAFSTPDQIRARLARCRYRFASLGATLHGFRSPSLYRAPRLFTALAEQFTYDSSVCDTDLEWVRGSGSAFPYRIGDLIEVPITLPMDASLIFMNYRYNEILKIWLEKLAWIRDVGGVAVLVTHCEKHILANPAGFRIYEKFLAHVAADSAAWITRPVDVARRYQDSETPPTHPSPSAKSRKSRTHETPR